MKHSISYTALIAGAVLFAGAANAQTPINPPAVIGSTPYTLVDQNGVAIPVAGNTLPDGTVTCTGCSYRSVQPGDPAADQISVPLVTASNPATGNTSTISADGFSTTGAVNAKTISLGGNDLGTTLSNQQGQISAQGGQITNIQATVDGHSVQINTLTGQVTQNGQDIGNLQTLTATHTVQIQSLNGQVVTLQGVTQTQGGQITDLQGVTQVQGGQIGSLQSWQGTLNGTSAGGSVIVSDTSGNTTTVAPSTITVKGPNGSVTIADPSITVTNGTAAGTTKIVNGGVGIGGAVVPTQGLAVLGGSTTDTLNVTGNSAFNTTTTAGLATFNGGTQTNGNAVVTGNTKTASLNVTGNAAVGGTLGVTGLTTTNGIANTGTVATDNLTSTTATIGTLGTTTINNSGAITSGSVKTGSLNVTGASVTNGITNTGNIATTTLSTSGAATLNSATVTNGLTVGGTTALNGGATVAGGLLVTGGVGVTGGLTADNATITGNATVNGNATVKGNTKTDTLTVTHAAAVNGPLTVQGPATFGGGIYANAAQTIDFGGNVVSGVAAPVLGTDAANKSYVDTGLTNLLNTEKADVKKLSGGIAAAFASAGPDRTGGQTGAIAFNGGFWNGHEAFGVAAIQRVADFGSWDISLGGSFAVADTGDLGGRVTAQIGWGGGYVPLK